MVYIIWLKIKVCFSTIAYYYIITCPIICETVTFATLINLRRFERFSKCEKINAGHQKVSDRDVKYSFKDSRSLFTRKIKIVTKSRNKKRLKSWFKCSITKRFHLTKFCSILNFESFLLLDSKTRVAFAERFSGFYEKSFSFKIFLAKLKLKKNMSI